MKEENSLISLSIKDFLSSKMLKYSILPFVITMIAMYVLFFYIAGIGLDSLGTMNVESTTMSIENGIPHTDIIQTQLEGLSILNHLMNYTLTSWLASFLIYAVGGVITLYLSIIIAIIVIGFLTPNILKEIQKRHYPEVEITGYSNIFTVFLQVFKWFLIMILMFVFLIPFYFIPIVGLIIFNLPLYYFFHKMITYDVASTIMSKEEKVLITHHKGRTIRLKTLALYLISLIPFAIYFGAVFYVIYIGHSYFYELRKLRSS